MSGGGWSEVGEEAANFGAAGIFGVIGAAFLIGSFRLDFGSPGMPGPAVFPAIAGGGIVLLSGALALRSAVRLRGPGAERISLGHRNSVLSILVLAAVAAVFEQLGFALTSFVMIATLTWTFSGAPWWRAALLSAAVTGVAYLVFARLLDVALPQGVLGGL
jgi:putative tricarboxylic transport membrane protein